jgi:transposase-like protein
MKPRAVHTEDPDALLAHVRLPARHRISCRTTNLIERSFEEERRRTKVIPRSTDERSAMKLVFASLIAAPSAGAGSRSPTSNATNSGCCERN